MRRTGLILSVVLLLPRLALAQPLFSPTQDPLAGERVFDAKGSDLVAHLRLLKRAK